MNMHVEVRGQPVPQELSTWHFETMSVSQWDLMLSDAQES